MAADRDRQTMGGSGGSQGAYAQSNPLDWRQQGHSRFGAGAAADDDRGRHFRLCLHRLDGCDFADQLVLS